MIRALNWHDFCVFVFSPENLKTSGLGFSEHPNLWLMAIFYDRLENKIHVDHNLSKTVETTRHRASFRTLHKVEINSVSSKALTLTLWYGACSAL